MNPIVSGNAIYTNKFLASLKIPHKEGFNSVEYMRLSLYSYGLIIPEALSIILILE